MQDTGVIQEISGSYIVATIYDYIEAVVAQQLADGSAVCVHFQGDDPDGSVQAASVSR